jgi:hypothetical protein
MDLSGTLLGRMEHRSECVLDGWASVLRKVQLGAFMGGDRLRCLHDTFHL